MAYNASNETQTVLCTVDKNLKGDKIRVSVIKNTKFNKTSIDVRNMYTAEDGEPRYSSKMGGVRMNAEMAPDVIAAMLMALDLNEIQDIFARVQEEKEQASADAETT